MNVVLYTADFEPITVLDLPLWLLDQLERQGAVRIAALKPPSWEDLVKPPDFEPPETVTIRCEKLRWRDGTLKPILVTDDDELALSLRPEWLPGQLQAVQAYRQSIRTLTDQLVRAMRK